MKKTKLSNHQIFALTACCTTGTTLISVASGVAALAKQDTWISSLIAPLLGLPIIWLYYYLGKKHPGKTLIDMFYFSFGKWFGFIISAFFVLFVCFLDVDELIFYIGNFMQTEYMTETPFYAFGILLAIALAIGMIYGIETLGRSSEIFVILVTVIIGLVLLFDLPNAKPENLQPVFEEGILPSLKGSLFLSSYMTWPLIILLMVYPASSENNKKTRNSLLYGYILGAVICFLSSTMSIMILGSEITARSDYPIYLMTKEINIGVIERIEGIISLVWILTAFIKCSVYFYAGAVGLSQMFKIENYKRLILPLSLVFLVYSGVVYPNAEYQAKWDTTTWIPFIATFGFLLPIIMSLVTKYKKRNSAK